MLQGIADFGTCMVLQWLRLRIPTTGGLGLIPGQGNSSHVPQFFFPFFFFFFSFLHWNLPHTFVDITHHPSHSILLLSCLPHIHLGSCLAFVDFCSLCSKSNLEVSQASRKLPALRSWKKSVNTHSLTNFYPYSLHT